jgi:N-acetylneuraminate synthase
MEPEEFALLVKEGSSAYESLGQSKWEMQSSERESRRLRRSLYIVENVKAGELVTYQNVRAIRPGLGCAPKFLESFFGRQFKSNFEKGTPMSPDLLEETI